MKVAFKKMGSIKISILSYKSCINHFIFLAESYLSSYVCVANVHMFIEAYEDSDFSIVVNNADIVTADGMPLAIGLKWLYKIQQDRIAGMDLLPNLLNESQIKGIKVFFYGGTKEMIRETETYCNLNYPMLNVAGLISPPFRELSIDEENQYIELINSSGAGFVFVALGCPKQERWMASMKGRINACMIGIGGALPVMIGMQKRAPKWMQNIGLEWMFRLFQEPRRLFGRYFKTNTIFIYLFVKEFLKVRILNKA